MHETLWPKYFLTDLSHNLNNVNPEAGEVNTLSDKFVKVFNDTLDKHGWPRLTFQKFALKYSCHLLRNYLEKITQHSLVSLLKSWKHSEYGRSLFIVWNFLILL